MKYLTLLFVICFLSCGSPQPKETYHIIYEFENPELVDDSAVLRTANTIKNRLNQFTRDYELELIPDKKLELTIKTDMDIVRLNALVSNKGALEFWECIDLNAAIEYVTLIDEAIANQSESTSSNSNDTFEVLDELSYPFSSLLGPPDYATNSFFSIAVKDTAQVRNYLNSQEVKRIKPKAYRTIDLLYSHFPVNDTIGFFFVKSNPSRDALINETHITYAAQNYSRIGKPTVAIKMNDLGANRWERMTTNAFNNQTRIAVCLNGTVMTAPTVSVGGIVGGSTEISGNFTLEEAIDLSLVLSSKERIPKLTVVDTMIIPDE